MKKKKKKKKGEEGWHAVVLTVVEDSVLQAVAADGGCGRKKEEEENLQGERTSGCCGCVGFLWWRWWLKSWRWWQWWLGRRRERESVWRDRRQKRKNSGEENWFSTDFGPNYLPPWSMKITSIYRWWKRDTLSLLVPNVGPWFDPKALQPLPQRNNDELLILCRKMAGWVSYFGAVSPLLQPR